MKNKDTSGVWGCPCGETGAYRHVLGHRKGASKRAACQGSMYRQESTVAPPSPESQESLESQEGQHGTFDGYEFLPGDDPTDSEEIARRLLEQRSSPVDSVVPPEALQEGEWQIEAPKEESPISQSRESVSLLITTRVMYDWFRANGWRQGDGSMSAWVTDVINTFWTHVLGKAIVVVDREEVMADAGARS